MNANVGWRNKHAAKEPEELLGLPCKGGNDVRTAGVWANSGKEGPAATRTRSLSPWERVWEPQSLWTAR